MPLDISSPQILPHNIDAEQGLLGCLLADHRMIDDIAEIITPDVFFQDTHRKIYEAIIRMSGAGQMVSPVTMKNEFEKNPALKDVGGGVYLADLASAIVSPREAKSYAAMLRDLAVRRAVIYAAQQTIINAQSSPFEMPAEKVLEQVEAELFAVAEGMTRDDDGVVMMSDVVNETLTMVNDMQSGRKTGLMTGIASLDNLTNGFWGGDLIIIAGRPSMGKTALALTVGYNTAKYQKKSVCVFSLEMPRDQLMQRYFARDTSIATGFQNRRGAFKDEHFSKMVSAGRELSGLKMGFDDLSGQTVHQIRTRARRFKRRQGLDLVIIDYLGLIAMDNRYVNKADQIGEVTRALKVMARDLNVPVILLHQLNREVEKREDKRPTLADLRDSGAIEQDADMVIFPYREEYYLEKNPPAQKQNESDAKFSDRKNAHYDRFERVKGCAEIIIAKHRKGQCGSAPSRFSGTRQVFYDADQSNPF